MYTVCDGIKLRYETVRQWYSAICFFFFLFPPAQRALATHTPVVGQAVSWKRKKRRRSKRWNWVVWILLSDHGFLITSNFNSFLCRFKKKTTYIRIQRKIELFLAEIPSGQWAGDLALNWFGQTILWPLINVCLKLLIWFSWEKLVKWAL